MGGASSAYRVGPRGKGLDPPVSFSAELSLGHVDKQTIDWESYRYRTWDGSWLAVMQINNPFFSQNNNNNPLIQARDWLALALGSFGLVHRNLIFHKWAVVNVHACTHACFLACTPYVVSFLLLEELVVKGVKERLFFFEQEGKTFGNGNKNSTHMKVLLSQSTSPHPRSGLCK